MCSTNWPTNQPADIAIPRWSHNCTPWLYRQCHPLTFLVKLCRAWCVRARAWNMHGSNVLFHVIECNLLHHVVSYWQSFPACRGDFKGKADINLNHKHCYCTVRSRPALESLFRVFRWRVYAHAWVCVCVCVLWGTRREWPTKTPLYTHTHLQPQPLQWGSLITLKGQNGHHNEADRGAIFKPPTLHCRVQKQQLRPWCYLCHYEMDVIDVAHCNSV